MFSWCSPSPLSRIFFLTLLLLDSMTSECRDLIETSQIGLSVPRPHTLCMSHYISSPLIEKYASQMMAEQGTEYNRMSLRVILLIYFWLF